MVQKVFVKYPDGGADFAFLSELPLCPWCERAASSVLFIECKSLFTAEEDFEGELADVVFHCGQVECHRLFVAEYYLNPNQMYELDGSELFQTHPPQPVPSVTDILQKLTLPDDVKLDLVESASCLKAELYQAFGAMVRRTVHSICADKKAVGGDLQQQIEFLRSNGMFSKEVADRAQELRTFGRHGAHPEWERIESGLGKQGMDLLVWIVRTVYHPAPPPDPQLRNTAKKRYTVPKK